MKSNRVRRKHTDRYLNILMVPDTQEAPPKNFRIRYTSLYFLIGFICIVVVSMIFGVITYSRVLQAALEKEEREVELVKLREQLKISQDIQAQIDTIKAYKEKVRNSLQGYIKFAEKAKEDPGLSERILTEMPQRSTITTSIPMKLPISGFVSQEFNWPEHPGIDIVAKVGLPVQAAADGRVIFSGWSGKYGYSVILYHVSGYLTFYRHNSQNLVTTHDVVNQGDVIALSGNSGQSSGPHIHFEIWKNGKPINPRHYLLDLNKVGE